jgi:hypothetical protein
MTPPITGLSGLLPAVGAIALITRSLRRNAQKRRARSGAATARHQAALMMPTPPKVPLPASAAGRESPFATGRAATGPASAPTSGAPRPTAECQGCGTSVPASEALCANCAAQKHLAEAPVPRFQTLLHWLLVSAMILGLLGLGYLAQHL